ncbi:MAG: Gmad2 immunoglobulin-like domain-containing protein [Candidatus Levybacteria bacterium]|nr:Gmad2 immunoglobulin-like domain-containing protein [Candidatus Levybacteria bacterium]
MQKIYVVFLIVFAVLVVGLGTSKARELKSLPIAIPTPTPKAPTTANVNIVVLSPASNSKLENPFLVRGRARVFENVVSIRLKDSSGNVIAEGTAYANAPDIGQFGDFEQYINFSTEDSKGVLEVYQASAKDGSDQDLVSISVKFR